MEESATKLQGLVSDQTGLDRHSASDHPTPSVTVTAAPTVSVYRSFDEIESLRPAWKELCRHCAADIDFLKTIVAKRPGFVRPHVMVLSGPGPAHAMLIGRVEQRPWRFWLKFRTAGHQPVSMLIVPEGGVFGDESATACEHLITEVTHALRRGEFDVAMFGGLRSGTPLHDTVRTIPPLLCRDHGLMHEAQWTARLPGTLDEFMRRISSEHRSIFRRKQRKLESANPGQVQFRSFTQPAEVEELVAAADEIAQETYQYRRGGSFRASREGMSFLELAARNQWLRGYVLYVAKHPIAFWIGTLYQNSCRLDTTGYIKDYRNFDPGIILFLHMVGDLCKQGVRQLNFGVGESAYKSRFGDEKQETATACVFAPTIKGAALMTARCLRYSVENTSRRIVSSIGLEHPLRKFWRSLPAVLRMKQTVEVVLACMVIIFSGTWQGWLKWPEGAWMTVALCLITSLVIMRGLKKKQTR